MFNLAENVKKMYTRKVLSGLQGLNNNMSNRAKSGFCVNPILLHNQVDFGDSQTEKHRQDREIDVHTDK